MSVLSNANTIEVFKFAGTGLVALCEEVVSYLDATDERDDLIRDADLESARYENRDGDHYIIFDRKR